MFEGIEPTGRAVCITGTPCSGLSTVASSKIARPSICWSCSNRSAPWRRRRRRCDDERDTRRAPVAEAEDGYERRSTDWGELTLAFETVPARTDYGPLLVGLPDDACQCPHWGYCTRGRFLVRYTDGTEETVEAGAAYYMAPGHRPVYVEETDTIEFSPADELRQTIELVARNAQEAAGR